MALKLPVKTLADSKFLCFLSCSFIDLKVGKLTLSVPRYIVFLDLETTLGVAGFSETSVYVYQTIRRRILEDRDFNERSF